jgi:hypothetical protein
VNSWINFYEVFIHKTGTTTPKCIIDNRQSSCICICFKYYLLENSTTDASSEHSCNFTSHVTVGIIPLYILQSLKESKKGVMGDFDYAE